MHCYCSAKKKSCDYIIRANNRYRIRECHHVYVCRVMFLFQMATLSRDSTRMMEY